MVSLKKCKKRVRGNRHHIRIFQSLNGFSAWGLGEKAFGSHDQIIWKGKIFGHFYAIFEVVNPTYPRQHKVDGSAGGTDGLDFLIFPKSLYQTEIQQPGLGFGSERLD